MPRSAAALVLAATVACAACAGPTTTAPGLAGMGVTLPTRIPWPEPAAGCEVVNAPARPEIYDERSVAALMTWVYRDAPVENYCGCAFRRDQSVEPSCGFGAPDGPPQRIRWEPVVPPSRFGVYRPCWEPGARAGRRNGQDDGGADAAFARSRCAATDEEFRAMEADLYNYHPVLAVLSDRRGAHPFAQVQGEPREFGSCDFETQSIMGKSLNVEPPPEVMGDIARVYLYMAARYGKGRDWKIKLSREQRQLYEKWSEADPVDDRERLRACRIAAIQGWDNPYVK
jgi:deoxyribonuclease I